MRGARRSLVVLTLLAAPAEVQPASSVCASPEQRVNEAQYVSIGGIEQWVAIDGLRCGNPVILFLDGGSGKALSPHANAIYGTWEGEFTLVQWDRRGTGKTYARNPPSAESRVTLERMTEDGIALAEYLTGHLGKKKLILTGGSRGSILGVNMAKRRPDLFYAYVGVAQMVSYKDDLSASYATVMGMARAANDPSTIAALEAIGPPPWTDPRNFGVLRRATRVYEAKTATPMPKSWETRSPGYEAETAATDAEVEDYDVRALGTTFEIPVFFVQGSEDLVARPDIARRYFNSITAPAKEFVQVPLTGHDLNRAMVDAQYRIMHRRVRPLAK